jgi:hypothetical protein
MVIDSVSASRSLASLFSFPAVEFLTLKKRLKALAANMAAIVEQHVANRVVGRMPAGSADPAAARSAITPVGNRVTLDVLMARKSTMGSVAVPG